jgi:DNA-binding NtrC family response regulator
MRRVQRLIDQLAPAEGPVAIVGEEGTGKELVARALHSAGKRRAGSFVLVNCDRRNIESEIFGAVAGAAPGLTKRRIGHLESGADTTVFLNDVALLGRAGQERLLDALETGAFQPVGAEERTKLAARVIVAATRPLADLVREGRLEPRLRMLLRVAQIGLPPLRQRLEDLPLLATHFLRKSRGESSRATSIDHSAYRTLMSYPWPGNIRELRAVIEQAASACEATQITREHLPPLGIEEAAAAHDGSEREWILDGLRRNRFRRDATARFLGISRKTLYNKMRTFGLPLDHRHPS